MLAGGGCHGALDIRTKELIAIGAAVAAHCQPCLKFHLDKSREEGIGPGEIAEAVEVVIVIHEIYGLTDWIRAVADRLAADGFIAIAPDLLSGMGPGGGGTDKFASRDGANLAASRQGWPATIGHLRKYLE
ncbi:MAG TPA: hypothetical protein DD658_01330 [Deltaproteobacteria bacterium]|nr:MAG: hypothetical protein A2X88_10180 [Deltaproteobacteria bacterium GWC2_65_14]HBO68850.1 hypothetical protein [Deltaproteobacteria bacterium]